MNVLFVLSRYPGFGGIEKVTTTLCNCLCESLTWVGVYSFEEQYEEELLPELNKKVHFIRSEIPYKYFVKSNVHQLSGLIKRNDVDAVIYQDSYAPYFRTVVAAIKKTKAKLIVVEHNTPECSLRTTPIRDVIKQNAKNNIARSILAYYKGRVLTRWHYIYKYLQCDRYILLSRKFEPSFRKLVPFASSKKVTAICNPVTVHSPMSTAEKKNICLFCGRLESAKGVDLLLEIWSIIEKRRKDWQLVIVGDGSDYHKAVAGINSHKLVNVRLEGFQQNTSAYYSQSKIFLMPSRYEGWGVSIFEAKIHGCVPVVFNSFASASEVVNDQKDGLLIPPFDIKRFAESVLVLMDDTQKRETLSHNAVEDTRRYAVNIICHQWIEFFDSLIKDRRNT